MFKVSPRLSSMPPRGRPFNWCKAFTPFSHTGAKTRGMKVFSLLNPALAKILWMNYNYIRYTPLSDRRYVLTIDMKKKKGREIAVLVENIKWHTTRAILSKSLLLLYSRRSQKWRIQDIEYTQAFLSKSTLVLLQMRFIHIKMLQVISHAVSYLQWRQPYIHGASCAFNWISNKFKWQRKLWNKKRCFATEI